MNYKNKLRKGLTLMETLISIAVLMIILVVGISFITYISKESKELKEKAFAVLKANQILSEIRNYVDSNKEALNLKYLHNFNDFNFNPYLTIENVSNPLLAPSENKPLNTNDYTFYRRIRVYPLPNRTNSDNVRVVEVSIFKRENNGNYKFLTSATTVINTLANFSPPTQVYDIYFLSIGTVPGWWVFTPQIRKVVDYVISDLEDRNNGLRINPHFITTMAYGGRDPYYSPFIGERINSPNDGTPLDSPFVYYLAGTSYINNSPSLPFRYNTFNLITGYINKKTETEFTKTYVYPYSIADQYNHAVRYPQELKNYQAIVEYTKQNNLPKPEISYRMLIEKLYNDPAYQNSIIINLHGELMPILPVRNYSDPAKLPYIDRSYYPVLPGQETKYKNIRVVVHPENIAYPDTSIPNFEDITLRVYAYQLNPNANILPNDRVENITLLIGPLKSSKYTISGYAIDGGTLPLNTDYTKYTISPTNITTSEATINLSRDPRAMYLKAKIYQKDGKNYLAILLKNTPTKCDMISISNNKGLPSNQRLYGLEYIPFMFPFGGFRELDYNSNSLPKNTARWVITIKNVEKTQDVNNPLEIRYTIDPSKSGGDPIIYPNFNYPFPDYSQSTYVWVCRNLNEIPITEQFQILGDPRLCPYKDVVSNMRYNKYFAYPSGTDLNTIRQNYFNNSSVILENGYPSGGGLISVDVPASFYIIREAFGKSHSVFNSITGFSFYYVGLGQETGGDGANSLPNGVPVFQAVFQNGNGVINGEQSIIRENGTAEAGFGVKNIVRLTNVNWGGTSDINSGDYVAWGNFALPFLNEIFPDDKYLYWKKNGNLNNNEFKKRRWRDSLSTSFPNNQVVRTGVSGCSSFFNAVPAGSAANSNNWFTHGWGNATSLAAHKQNIVSDMEQAFNFSLPSDITSARPFQINLNFQGQPPEWNTDTFYIRNRFFNSIYGIYYNHDGANNANIASAVIRTTKQDGAKTYHWVVVNGLSPQGSEAQSFVARYSIMSSLYSFLLAGNDTNANVYPIPMIPLLNITNPTNTQEINSNNINITWNIDFKRWDSKPYVPRFSVIQNRNNYFYLIKYQRLGDNKWYFIQDINSSFPCDIGDLPTDSSYRIYTNNYNWNLSNLQNGMYWLVVEAHHNTRINHYSYHMIFVNINK